MRCRLLIVLALGPPVLAATYAWRVESDKRETERIALEIARGFAEIPPCVGPLP